MDNGSTDNYKIEPKFNNNVTLIYNDKKHAQVELGEKYLKEHIRGKFKWVLVVDLDILNKIRDSGLYNIVNEIRCCVLGSFNKNDEIFQDNKVRILKTSENLK